MKQGLHIKVTEGRIANTNPTMVSADEAADVGVDEGTQAAVIRRGSRTGRRSTALSRS